MGVVQPRLVLSRFNFAPGATTNFQTTDLRPQLAVAIWRIMIQVATAASFIVKETSAGVTVNLGTYVSGALPAGKTIIADYIVENNKTYNFQVDAGVNVDTFKIVEVGVEQ